MKKKYKKLIKKFQLVDQTAFIEDLLKNDRHMKYLNHLQNINWYGAKLSTGNFEGTDVDYYRLLKELQIAHDTNSNPKERKAIRKDIFTLEGSYIGERIVSKWYAIPFFVGIRLVEKGEIILFSEKSCWLGVI